MSNPLLAGCVHPKCHLWTYHRWHVMSVLKPSQDVQPLSAFRQKATGFLEQIRSTKRSFVLTQHGKSAAVVLDVDHYEVLLAELELIRDIHQAKSSAGAGRMRSP